MADWTQVQKITSTPRGVGAQFGHAVAINGNTMVVGARFDNTTAFSAGAAFVYVLDGTTWTQQARLLASDGATFDKFGQSVAISGDTIVVGAYQDDAPLSNGGSAYVFVRNGTTWTQQQKLAASDGTADDEFGNSVAITGDTVIVGAHFADLPSNSAAGSVYRFARSGTVWTQVQKLIPTASPTGPILGDQFGESLATSGDKLVVGSAHDDSPETAAGAVYVFVDSGGAYSLQQKISIPVGKNGDQFGFSVAIEGNTLVGGARENTPIIGQPAYGAAYVFELNGLTWVSQGKLTASDGAAFDRFGWSVAVSNNVVAVGAYDDDTTVGPDAGSAYLFTRSGATWTQIQKLVPADPFNGDRFGASVALSFGHLVVGASEKQLTAPNGQGAAYYFLPAPSTPSTPTGLVVTVTGNDVDVRWSPAAGATAYHLRATLNGALIFDGDLGNITSVGARALQSGRYVVEVFSQNAAGQNPVPAVTDFMIGGLPSTPTGVTATVVGRDVDVRWNPAAGAIAYHLRATLNGALIYDGDVGDITGVAARALQPGRYVVEVFSQNAAGQNPVPGMTQFDVF